MAIGDNNSGESAKTRSALLVIAGLGFALALALALRLIGLAEPSLSHPEIYIPGIDLPGAISEPPRRFDFLYTLNFHFHYEPHPVGYYMAMWGWTAIFGDSHFALRFPQVLSGLASIYLIYKLAALVFSRPVGIVSALMLAMHGTHIFWSQNARAYAPGAMLGLLATWLLLKIASEEKPGPLLCAGYVVAIVAGVQTTELIWALFGVHIGWVVLRGGGEAFSWKGFAPKKWYVWRVSRLAYLQSAALMLSLPALLHSAYGAVRGYTPDPDPSFLVEYAAFGFAFIMGAYADLNYTLPPALPVPVAIICLVLVYFGVRAGKQGVDLSPTKSIDMDARILLLLAFVVAAVMFWMASIAENRRALLIVMSAFPFAALGLPPVVAMGRPILKWAAPPLDQFILRNPLAVSPIVLLAIFAPLVLFALSIVASVLAARAFLVFTPYMLILAAAGLVSLWPRKRIFAVATAVIAAIFVTSAVAGLQRPNSSRDYKTIAAVTMPLIQPNDLIFVRNHDWADTPLLYYLKTDGIVAGNYAAALKESGARRVWIFHWTDARLEVGSDEMLAALEDFTASEQAQARRAKAFLFERADGKR